MQRGRRGKRDVAVRKRSRREDCVREEEENDWTKETGLKKTQRKRRRRERRENVRVRKK